MKKGLSLVEILLALSILALFAGPIAYLFLSTNRARVSARELSLAMNLSSSYLSSLKDLPRSEINILPPTSDQEVPSILSPHHLGIPAPPQRFHRSLEIRELAGQVGLADAYLMIVKVRWSRGENLTPGEFHLESVLPGEE